jgi:hypothetical protein
VNTLKVQNIDFGLWIYVQVQIVKIFSKTIVNILIFILDVPYVPLSINIDKIEFSIVKKKTKVFVKYYL